MYRTIHFPEADLAPGESRRLRVDLTKSFKATRLSLRVNVDAIRGHFWIKRSRLPRLDRDLVTAYSTLPRRKSARRTVVHYEGPDRQFERAYLPSSVAYVHQDPNVALTGIFVGADDKFPPPLPDNPFSVPSTHLHSDTLGGELAFTRGQNMAVDVVNRDRVRVTVLAAVHGIGKD